MDCMNFLETARFLENSGTCEADFRSAVSRSYYACYLTIGREIFNVSKSEWETIRGFFSQNNIKHWVVKGCLVDSSVSELKYIGGDFKTLQTKRKSADYDMEAIFQRNDASEALELAERIVTAFSDVEQRDLQRAASEFIASNHQ